MVPVTLWMFCASLYAANGQTLPVLDKKSNSVCYGDSTQYLATCDADVTGTPPSVIVVTDIIAGTNINGRGCPDNYNDTGDQACCIKKEDDCLSRASDKQYKVWLNHCSGKWRCSHPGTERDNTDSGKCNSMDYVQLSHYFHMEYYCVPGSQIHMLSKSSLVTQEYSEGIVFLQNLNYPANMTVADNGSECSIETLDCSSTIQMYILHLELMEINGNCAQQHLVIRDVDGNSILQLSCKDNSFHGIPVQETKTNYITLYVQNTDQSDGGRFWIGFGDSSVNVTINCPASSPKSPCMTTSSSTSTSSTTTTTSFATTNRIITTTATPTTATTMTTTIQTAAATTTTTAPTTTTVSTKTATQANTLYITPTTANTSITTTNTTTSTSAKTTQITASTSVATTGTSVLPTTATNTNTTDATIPTIVSNYTTTFTSANTYSITASSSVATTVLPFTATTSTNATIPTTLSSVFPTTISSNTTTPPKTATLTITSPTAAASITVTHTTNSTSATPSPNAPSTSTETKATGSTPPTSLSHPYYGSIFSSTPTTIPATSTPATPMTLTSTTILSASQGLVRSTSTEAPVVTTATSSDEDIVGLKIGMIVLAFVIAVLIVCIAAGLLYCKLVFRRKMQAFDDEIGKLKPRKTHDSISQKVPHVESHNEQLSAFDDEIGKLKARETHDSISQKVPHVESHNEQLTKEYAKICQTPTLTSEEYIVDDKQKDLTDNNMTVNSTVLMPVASVLHNEMKEIVTPASGTAASVKENVCKDPVHTNMQKVHTTTDESIVSDTNDSPKHLVNAKFNRNDLTSKPFNNPGTMDLNNPASYIPEQGGTMLKSKDTNTTIAKADGRESLLQPHLSETSQIEDDPISDTSDIYAKNEKMNICTKPRRYRRLFRVLASALGYSMTNKMTRVRKKRRGQKRSTDDLIENVIAPVGTCMAAMALYHSQAEKFSSEFRTGKIAKPDSTDFIDFEKAIDTANSEKETSTKRRQKKRYLRGKRVVPLEKRVNSKQVTPKRRRHHQRHWTDSLF